MTDSLPSPQELKPCPFCGGDAHLSKRHLGGYDIMCKTPDCFMEFGADWFLPKSVAIETWNRRTQPWRKNYRNKKQIAEMKS